MDAIKIQTPNYLILKLGALKTLIDHRIQNTITDLQNGKPLDPQAIEALKEYAAELTNIFD